MNLILLSALIFTPDSIPLAVGTWTVFGSGMPNTAVSSMSLQGTILTAATHGRGAWQILTQ